MDERFSGDLAGFLHELREAIYNQRHDIDVRKEITYLRRVIDMVEPYDGVLDPRTGMRWKEPAPATDDDIVAELDMDTWPQADDDDPQEDDG